MDATIGTAIVRLLEQKVKPLEDRIKQLEAQVEQLKTKSHSGFLRRYDALKKDERSAP